MDQSVSDDAFRLRRSVRVHGRELDTDYVLEITKDQIGAAAVTDFAAHIAKAQDLLVFSLSTAHSGDWTDKAPTVAGLVLVLLAAAWSIRRNVRALLARRAAARTAGDVGGHAPAANDSRQDLAA